MATDTLDTSTYHIYRNAVDQLLTGQENLPSLPAITLQVRKELRRPTCTHQSLARAISKDPSLTALIMKNAYSPAFRTHEAPKELSDAIAIMGLGTIEQVTMSHSVKSLFVFDSPQLKKLFTHSWKRQVLKSATADFLAQKLRFSEQEKVVIGCLMSDIGTLSVLSAFRQQEQLPSPKVYYALCREYSKSLGLVLLKKWQMHEHYEDVVLYSGKWQRKESRMLDVIDIINLALYHTVTFLSPKANLPPLQEIAAYQKLAPEFKKLSGRRLQIIDHNRDEIQAMANIMQ